MFLPSHGAWLFKLNKTKRRHSGVFILNFEQISHLVLIFLLLNVNRKIPFGAIFTRNRILLLYQVLKAASPGATIMKRRNILNNNFQVRFQ